MFKNIKSFTCGFLAASLVASPLVYAMSSEITKTLTYKSIKTVVDGNEITLKDANDNPVEPFIIDGTTYIPVRAIGEAYDKDVAWDGETSTVTITTKPQEAANSSNLLTMAVAWKQTAAEYRALYHQGFNLATAKVKVAIENRKDSDKPLAVLTDLDDTLVLPLNYWGSLIKDNKDFFDDGIWDKWIPKYEMQAAPGAVEFLKFCKDNNVEIHYVTSRDQGEKTYEYALETLIRLDFPNADEDHLTVLIESSNKEPAQQSVSEKYNVVCLLGDNLNDFSRAYYVKDVDERNGLMEKDKALFGEKYIIFPNPTDGHWIRAIFGDSEPPASDENRAIFEDAAMRNTMKPKYYCKRPSNRIYWHQKNRCNLLSNMKGLSSVFNRA